MYTVLDKIYAGQNESGKSIYRVTIQCDTAADMPDPEEHWAPGSTCDVLEDGGARYRLSNAGTWVEVPNFTGAGSSSPAEPMEQNVEWVEDVPEGTFFSANKSDSTLHQFVKSIKIPEGVNEIRYGCFEGWTRLKEVYLPDTVETIGSGAFSDCTALESIHLSENLRELGGSAFGGCTALHEIVFPGSLKAITANAISGSGIKKVTLCSGTETIEGGAFGGVNMEEIILPDTLKKIEDGAFLGSGGLKKIDIPASVESIGGSFPNCLALAEINVHKPEGSITGAPWSAVNATVNWLG